MKLSLAAAAIAFSGTALMFAPATASAAPQGSKSEATAKAGWDGGDLGKSGMAGKSEHSTAKIDTMDYDGMGALETSMKADTGADSGAKLAADTDGKFGMADMDMGAKFQTASDTGSKSWSGDGDMADGLHAAGMDTGTKIHTASLDGSGKNPAGKAGDEDQMASAKQTSHHDSSQPIETAAVSKESVAPGAAMGQGKEAYAGMGGPEEGSGDYPPCRPGPGDDRCIQLYEVGGSGAKGRTAKA